MPISPNAVLVLRLCRLVRLAQLGKVEACVRRGAAAGGVAGRLRQGTPNTQARFLGELSTRAAARATRGQSLLTFALYSERRRPSSGAFGHWTHRPHLE